MTKKTGGASQSVMETFTVLHDGYRTGLGTGANPITTDRIDCFQVIVQNDPGNANNMYIGNATSQSIVLTPGQSETIPLSGRVGQVYVRFVAGTDNRVNWHAMG